MEGGVIVSKENSNSGIGFFGVLTILFIALKLTKFISWSWLWVLAPTWIPLVISLVFILIYVVTKIMKA